MAGRGGQGSPGNGWRVVPGGGGSGFKRDQISEVMGGRGDGQQSNDGLNPSRQRGFNWQQRIETPTLNDMKARQGAVVSKFMTFNNRKNTAIIELYERVFYNKRPGWDSLANFVYSLQ